MLYISCWLPTTLAWAVLIKSTALLYPSCKLSCDSVWMCRWSLYLAPVTVWYQWNGSWPHFFRIMSENVKENIKQTIKFLHLIGRWVVCYFNGRSAGENSSISTWLCFGSCHWIESTTQTCFLTWTPSPKLSSLLYRLCLKKTTLVSLLSHQRVVFLSLEKNNFSGSICIIFSPL